MNRCFQGIFPPIVTPLDSQECVDEGAFSKLIERVIAQGVHGLYLLGSTGEGVAFPLQQRQKAIEVAVAAVGGRIPIICGVMDSSTKRVLANVEMAESLGVQAVAATPPYYYPCSGNDELISFFGEVAANTGLPVFIYNIPQMTKIMIPAEIVGELNARIPNIAGIKDSSGDWSNFLRLYEAVGQDPQFSLFLGSHFLAGAGIWYGAAGAVLSISNIDPAMCVALYNAAKQGDLQTIQQIQTRILTLSRLYTLGAQASCIKTCLELMGLCTDDTTSPLQPLTEAARVELKVLLTSVGLLEH